MTIPQVNSEEILQWIEEQHAARKKQSNTRRRCYRAPPSVTVLLFKLRMIRTGQQIVAMRQERGWSRQQLAMRSKIKSQILQQMERGKIQGVHIDDYSGIARAFNCAFDIKITPIIMEASDLACTESPLSVPSFDEETTQANNPPEANNDRLSQENTTQAI